MKHAAFPALSIVFGIGGMPSAADPIDYWEFWDTYQLGIDDAAYLENWPTIGDSARFDIELNAANGTDPNTFPNTLLTKKDITLGIMHDLTADAISPGEWVVGTDQALLELGFIVDLNAVVDKIPYADLFVEISLQGEHVPEIPGTLVPVLAFGMTYGINGESVHPWFFDGQNWNEATGITTDRRWHIFRVQIDSSSVNIIGERRASGSQTFPRMYMGGFDTISVRSIDNDDLGQRRYLDDTWLTGGEIVPRAPSGACCFGYTCAEMEETECLSNGGVFQGDLTSCSEITCCPVPFADADLDQDVDQRDFAIWQLCYTGDGNASIPSAPEACVCMDRDHDLDVDATDFAEFHACGTGPAVPWSIALTPQCNP